MGDGVTLRMISDIKGVKYTEGRFLPYFFPDVFNENGNPIKEAKENWLKARRAILRSPLSRMGYGGYLKLALITPGFIDTIKEIIEEFRTIHDLHTQDKPCAISGGYIKRLGQYSYLDGNSGSSCDMAS